MSRTTYVLVCLALLVVCAGLASCKTALEKAEQEGLITQVRNPETGEVFWVLTDKGAAWIREGSDSAGGLLSGLTGVNLGPVIESLVLLALGAAGVKPAGAAIKKVANGGAKKPATKK